MRYGKSTPATTVHHVYPLEQRPELSMVNWNLISLCCKCHDSMHDRSNNELTELGKAWLSRVSPQNTAEVQSCGRHRGI
ncbi:MAG: hypothetical protein C4589_11075 [Peptococcaceae bacterium]|nr:MAG: hypothetical protein C4589_11075 [Peptococcaceae bacterium]